MLQVRVRAGERCAFTSASDEFAPQLKFGLGGRAAPDSRFVDDVHDSSVVSARRRRIWRITYLWTGELP
jgi:hypothetical protein